MTKTTSFENVNRIRIDGDISTWEINDCSKKKNEIRIEC